MFKHLQNLAENESGIKEARAMRKDIPLISEMQMRDQMSAAVLMAYADHLECTKNIQEIKTIINGLAQKFQDTNYVTNSFVSSVMSQLNTKLSKRSKIKEKIKMQFLNGQKIEKALETFSDPRLVVEKKIVISSIPEDSTDNINAVMEVYLDDVLSQMRKSLTLEHEFLKNI